MTEATPRCALPTLSAGQAHKEITHNEALARVDALLHPTLKSATTVSPPSNAEEGAMWLVPENATDAWAQHSGEIALWQAGAWTFFIPFEGYCAWVASERCFALFDGQKWGLGIWPVKQLELAGEIMLQAPQPAIMSPSGGATVDQEARQALQLVLQALRAHRLIRT